MKKLSNGVVLLSLADQECFAQALLSPPKATSALKRAYKRRTKLLTTTVEENVSTEENVRIDKDLDGKVSTIVVDSKDM